MVAKAMESARARLDDVENKGLDTCTTCPSLCRFACPVAEVEARETTSPHRLVTMAQLVKKGVARVEATAQVAYHCSGCDACKSACLHDNDVPLLLSLLRSRIVDQGFAPPVVRQVLGHFAVAANPTGTSLEPALETALAAVGRKRRRRAAVTYFPGCSTLELAPETVSTFFRACDRVGAETVEATRVASECCGLPLLWAGDVDGFAGHARRIAASLEGVERLVVQDPACALAFKHHYPQIGVTVGAQVEHVSTFLARFPSQSVIGTSVKRAYLDNCSLARGLDEVSAPRALLGEDDLVELAGGVGADVDCCGAQGLLPLTAPATARAMAEGKIDAFVRSGAAELVTSSPRCAAHLKRVDPSLPVVDISEVVARR